MVTDAVVERVAESEHLVFEGVGQVKLKGFDEPRQLCRATMPPRAERRGAALDAARAQRAGAGRASRCWCMLSGGADSVCLLDVALRLGARRVRRCT